MTNMVETHVRFKPDAYEAIKEIANENNISVANLVRMAVEMNLSKYLSSIQYIDSVQGDKISQQINILSQETVKIKNEINRIGVNINQCVKAMHYSDILEKVQTKMQVEEMQKQLLSLMKQYDAIVEKEGDALWHIQR